MLRSKRRQCLRSAYHHFLMRLELLPTRHRHAGSVFAYVLSGSIRSENSVTGPARVYKTGEGFFVPSAAPYAYSAGPDGAEVLEIKIYQPSPEGQPSTYWNRSAAGAAHRTLRGRRCVHAQCTCFARNRDRGLHAR